MALFSTYKLYKQGTSQVVAWLGKTAARFGYALASADTQKDEKAEAPKQEKKTKKTIPKSSSESETHVTKHTVSIRELPVLAKVISERIQQTVDCKTLPGILEVLKDVIVKRKQWAKQFGMPDASTLASNLQHKHFLAVLEDVYETLGGVVSVSQVDKGQPNVVADNDGESTSTEEIALSNLFAVLDVEETVAEEETADQEEAIRRPTRSPSRARPLTITYELEEEIDDEEVYFMIYCFFMDFLAVRNHLGKSWADYNNGLLDLAAVAVTTNVALEMLHRAEIALFASLPKSYSITDYQHVGLLLQLVVAQTRGVDPTFRQQRGDVINMDLKDIADFTCWPVFTILSSFLLVLKGGDHVPVLKPGHFGKLDLTGQPLSWPDKVQQDKIVLCELLPEVCILTKIKMGMPVVDKLSRGLMEMIQTKKIPIWLVLGCQIHLDIHHTMLSRICKAHRDLQTVGLHVSKTLQDYFDFSKGMSIDTWVEDNDKFLTMIKLEADLWVNQDVFAPTQKKLFKTVNLPESTARPYSLFSRHPLLCGLMLFRLNLRLQEAGVVLVNAWGSLPTVIHLYNALKQEFLQDGFPLWKDLETVIQIQGKERIFVGDYPKSAMEYSKRFCLVMGYSASIFTQNRREGRHTPQTQTPASSRGPRQMIDTSAIADVFRGQYCENETRSEVTIYKIEKLLSTSALGKQFGTSSDHRPCQFTSLTFLSALRAHIQAGILALNINYFALHSRCFTLLREIHVKLDPEFRKYAGPQYVVKESQLPFLVGYLFMIASGSGKAAEFLKLTGRDVVVKSQVLKKAAVVVKDLVQKEGDLEIESVKRICRR